MNVGQAAQMYPVGSSSVGSTEDELPRHDRHFTKLCNNMCENVKNIASTSSGTVSINISSTALSQTVPIMGSGPSGTGHTNPTAIVHVEETYDEPQVKRQKKCTSPVWDHYTKYSVTAMEKSKKVVQQWAKCNHCVYKARCESVNGTKVFWNHLKYKHSLKPGQQQLKLENNHEDGTSVVEPYRYDQEASLKKFYLAIIMHEYPFNIVEHEYFIEFIKSLRPNFPIKSRVIVKKELMDIFVEEKNKLLECFKSVQCRFSTTIDMWTSNQNKGYMCVTVHWIDDNWCIQKRIINFMHVGGRHTGAKLSDAFTASIMRWYIEKKLFSLILDNASANEVCVKDVIVELKTQSPLICDGMFFHARCGNHILNLVARDGLQKIATAVHHIRSFVAAVKGSPLQWEEFQKCASQCQLDTKRGVSLDVVTRWNSTYIMLWDALYYRKAFERLVCMERRTYENIAPSVAEWEKVSTLCKCLKKFHDVTELFSGTLYPTANLFYPRFCDIKLLISEWCASPDTTISKMAFSMHAKFEKYWKKSNIALAVACFLDPRRKKKCIEFYMKKFYGPMLYEIELEEFTKVVKQLYDSYASSYSKSTSAPSVTSEPKDDSMEEGNDELENFLYNTHGTNQGDANDLDKYMAEPLLRLAKSNQKFDILSWWKNQQDIYPILSHIARDVLAMQVSTAASESAFNTGGRVIDQFRSHLDPEIVEALICTKDWVAASRKDSSNKVASIINDLEVVDTLIANMVIVDEEKIANDED